MRLAVSPGPPARATWVEPTGLVRSVPLGGDAEPADAITGRRYLRVDADQDGACWAVHDAGIDRVVANGSQLTVAAACEAPARLDAAVSRLDNGVAEWYAAGGGALWQWVPGEAWRRLGDVPGDAVLVGFQARPRRVVVVTRAGTVVRVDATGADARTSELGDEVGVAVYDDVLGWAWVRFAGAQSLGGWWVENWPPRRMQTIDGVTGSRGTCSPNGEWLLLLGGAAPQLVNVASVTAYTPSFLTGRAVREGAFTFDTRLLLLDDDGHLSEHDLPARIEVRGAAEELWVEQPLWQARIRPPSTRSAAQ